MFYSFFFFSCLHIAVPKKYKVYLQPRIFAEKSIDFHE